MEISMIDKIFSSGKNFGDGGKYFIDLKGYLRKIGHSTK
jgi:hypothetical protein